jgi:hypothetical protein
MLVAESRIFQVVTFGMLHLHHSELDQKRLLLDVMAIADEVDAQLMGAVRSLTAKGTPNPEEPRRSIAINAGVFSPPSREYGAVEACRTGQKPKLLQWSLTPYSVGSADLASQRCTGRRLGKAERQSQGRANLRVR